MTSPQSQGALAIENSKLRADLLAERAISAQLAGFRDHFETALGERVAEVDRLRTELESLATAAAERDATIRRLEANLRDAARGAGEDAERHADQERVSGDLKARLGRATGRLDELQRDLDGRDADVRAKAAEAAELREELRIVTAAHRDLQVGDAAIPRGADLHDIPHFVCVADTAR